MYTVLPYGPRVFLGRDGEDVGFSWAMKASIRCFTYGLLRDVNSRRRRAFVFSLQIAHAQRQPTSTAARPQAVAAHPAPNGAQLSYGCP